MTRYSKFLFGVSVTLLGLLLILGRKNSNTLPFIEPLDNGSFYCSVSDTVFGIDVSHHNGIIDWETLKLNHPEIEFAESEKLLMRTITICRNEHETCLIEGSVNSCRISFSIKKNEIE